MNYLLKGRKLQNKLLLTGEIVCNCDQVPSLLGFIVVIANDLLFVSLIIFQSHSITGVQTRRGGIELIIRKHGLQNCEFVIRGKKYIRVAECQLFTIRINKEFRPCTAN